jgi:hypothetical protein
MNTPRVEPSSLARANVEAAVRGGSAISAGPFVINLCSSTTPVALSQPQDSELKRFTFFVSRRLEDGRERFRMHMGFFETLQDAEEWLGVVREVYPGAWAGEAPGKRLRPTPEPLVRAMQAPAPSAPAMAPSTPAAAPRAPLSKASSPSPTPQLSPARPSAAAPAVKAEPARPQSATLARAAVRTPAAPTARPAPSKTRSARPEPPTIFPAPATAAPPAVRSKVSGAASAPSRGVASPMAAPRAAVIAPAPVRGVSTFTPSRPAASTAPIAPQGPGPAKAVVPNAAAPNNGTASAKTGKSSPAAQLPFSNVREVLRALDETGSTQQMPAFESVTVRSAAPPSLSDSQVLKLLETRRSDDGHASDDSSIAVLKPDDTGTRRELKDAVASNAPVSFAVQLQWSVQPIEIVKVPPLAIFSAYTLYTVEGSREGRRWYGLRLGFFTDAISAKQVAQYVRSEFASVAVVPVGAQERTRATATDRNGKAKASAAPAPILDKLPGQISEFKLIEEPAKQPPPQPAKPAAKEPAKSGAPAKRPGKAPAGRVRAREKRSPQTLEETLEILGADELEIDNGDGASLNDTGVRHLAVEVRKESPFTRLLDRLSERARKGR